MLFQLLSLALIAQSGPANAETKVVKEQFHSASVFKVTGYCGGEITLHLERSDGKIETVGAILNEANTIVMQSNVKDYASNSMRLARLDRSDLRALEKSCESQESVVLRPNFLIDENKISHRSITETTKTYSPGGCYHGQNPLLWRCVGRRPHLNTKKYDEYSFFLNAKEVRILRTQYIDWSFLRRL